MRLMIRSGMVFLAMTLGAFAQEQSRVEGVIQNQIDAFQADDFATAFTYASPGIRRMFGSADNFGMMVRQGYPMVWRPSDVRFGAREEVGGRVLQTVIVTDQAGTVHALQYEMMPAGESWQINGVRFIEPPEVGA